MKGWSPMLSMKSGSTFVDVIPTTSTSSDCFFLKGKVRINVDEDLYRMEPEMRHLEKG